MKSFTHVHNITLWGNVDHVCYVKNCFLAFNRHGKPVSAKCIQRYISLPTGISLMIFLFTSPSDICLSSCKDISAYLLRSDTCKCGLECPLMVGEVFSFDPHVEGIPFSLGDIPQSGDLSKLCSHRRNVLSMAPFFSTAAAHDASAPESGVPLQCDRWCFFHIGNWLQGR